MIRCADCQQECTWYCDDDLGPVSQCCDAPVLDEAGREITAGMLDREREIDRAHYLADYGRD